MSHFNGMEYIRQAYDVPAKRGMRVTVDGHGGKITGSDGQYLRVRFDGGRRSLKCHPTWRVVYHTLPGLER